MDQAYNVEDQGAAGQRGVPYRARADVGQNGEEGENREERPAVGSHRKKADERGPGGGDEDRKEEGVVEPAEPLGVHDADLDEQAQREVQEEQDNRGVEDQGRKTRYASGVSCTIELSSTPRSK